MLNKMVTFDSDRCFHRNEIRFDKLSISQFDEYVSLFNKYVHGYQKAETETESLFINRIERKFRFIIEDTLDGFNPSHLSLYRNGNLKTIEAIFYLINHYCSILFAIKDFTPEIPEIDHNGLDSIIWYNVLNSNLLLKNDLGFLLKKYDFNIDKGFYTDKEAFRKYLKDNDCAV